MTPGKNQMQVVNSHSLDKRSQYYHKNALTVSTERLETI